MPKHKTAGFPRPLAGWGKQCSRNVKSRSSTPATNCVTRQSRGDVAVQVSNNWLSSQTDNLLHQVCLQSPLGVSCIHWACSNRQPHTHQMEMCRASPPLSFKFSICMWAIVLWFIKVQQCAILPGCRVLCVSECARTPHSPRSLTEHKGCIWYSFQGSVIWLSICGSSRSLWRSHIWTQGAIEEPSSSFCRFFSPLLVSHFYLTLS